MPATPPSTPHWGTVPLEPGQTASPVAGAWLAEQLGRDPGGLAITRSEHGRPMLAAPAGVDCNWSHSGGLLAITLGYGMQVGIDIERERPRPRALELARRFFTTAEADWLATCPDPGHDFLRLWCAKEAVLKAHGRGLAFGLEKLEFQDSGTGLRMRACAPGLGAPGHWQLREITPAAGYLGALAWRTAPAGPEPRHTAPR